MPLYNKVKRRFLPKKHREKRQINWEDETQSTEHCEFVSYERFFLKRGVGPVGNVKSEAETERVYSLVSVYTF